MSVVFCIQFSYFLKCFHLDIWLRSFLVAPLAFPQFPGTSGTSSACYRTTLKREVETARDSIKCKVGACGQGDPFLIPGEVIMELEAQVVTDRQIQESGGQMQTEDKALKESDLWAGQMAREGGRARPSRSPAPLRHRGTALLAAFCVLPFTFPEI